MPSYIWLIPLLPLFGLLLIMVVGFPRPRLSGYFAILTIGAAFVLSVLAFFYQAAQPATGAPVPHVELFNWYNAGGSMFQLGAIFDPLAALMLVTVTMVSLLVQIYSQGYMHGDQGYSKFFAFMCIFTTSMLGLVLA